MMMNGLIIFFKHNLNKLTAPAINQKRFLLEEVKTLEDNIKKMSTRGSGQKVEIHNAIVELNKSAIETAKADKKSYIANVKPKRKIIPAFITESVLYCGLLYFLYAVIKLSVL